MKKYFPPGARVVTILVSFFLLSSFYSAYNVDHRQIKFPYQQAGLTERQAAAHLLSRFTFGARPGDIDNVVKQGLDNWFVTQLQANLPDDSLNRLLAGFESLKMTNKEIVNTYPRPADVLKMARKEGIIKADSDTDIKEYRDEMATYMQQNGMKPQKELFRQLINQKILRATVSNNQLQEVLTDFWFNHFNVSLTKNQSASFVPAYERDVIRPRVFGKFEDLLLATAKAPAMLTYLDNITSAGTNPELDTEAALKFQRRLARMDADKKDSVIALFQKQQQNKKNQGLNENYAREVMELHTLGVDGGYTQQDVTMAARVLTGWTIYPMGENGYGNAIKKIIDKIGEDKLAERGFVHEGDFLFAATRHDTKEKVVLGKKFAANGGYEEGVELLQMLANHPSTAAFICKKLAIRFVSDDPSPALVNKMAKTFLEKGGNIKEVLITMVSAPEFWSKQALREKTKSPFELAISAVRSLNAKVDQPYQLYNWITKMGQKIYYYQAPTGFPDKGQYWINTGSLLNRMNFGLALSAQRIPGIKIDLPALNNSKEPESAEAALLTYTKLMLPERNVDETVKRLTPMLNDPLLGKKIDEAASKTSEANLQKASMGDDAMMADSEMMGADNMQNKENKNIKNNVKKDSMAAVYKMGNNGMLAQVVGIIIGSPEFQRR